jgi:hypothetical protein
MTASPKSTGSVLDSLAQRVRGSRGHYWYLATLTSWAIGQGIASDTDRHVRSLSLSSATELRHRPGAAIRDVTRRRGICSRYRRFRAGRCASQIAVHSGHGGPSGATIGAAAMTCPHIARTRPPGREATAASSISGTS